MTETKNTFRILFYIKRNALLRNGSAPIMGRITINGERAQFSTRLSVDPQVWDPHSGRVLGRRAPAERINERLDRIRMRLEQCYESLLDHAQRLTPNAVKNLFFGREQHREQLLGFFRRHNEEFGRMVGINRSKATFYKYRCVCNHLESYIRTRYGRDDLEFGELDREFLYGFHRHISGACGCSKNTIWIYMIALKHILAQARSRGYLKADLFAGYKIRSERVLRGYLSVEEIRRLIRLDLPDRTQRLIRDAFLFGCFTGLSYVDSGSLRHRTSSIRIGRSGSARAAAKQPQRSACACFRLRKRFCPVICRSRKTAGFSTCPQTDGAMPACRSFCSRRASRATSRSIAPGTPSPPPSHCRREWQSRRSASCSGTKTYAPHRSMRHSPMQSWQTIWSYCPNGSKSNLRHESASLYFGLHQE